MFLQANQRAKQKNTETTKSKENKLTLALFLVNRIIRNLRKIEATKRRIRHRGNTIIKIERDFPIFKTHQFLFELETAFAILGQSLNTSSHLLQTNLYAVSSFFFRSLSFNTARTASYSWARDRRARLRSLKAVALQPSISLLCFPSSSRDQSEEELAFSPSTSISRCFSVTRTVSNSPRSC